MVFFKNALLFVSVLLGQTVFAESGWQTLGDLVRVGERPNQVELSAQRGKVRLIALAPDVIRVTYAPNGMFPAEQFFQIHFRRTPNCESRKAMPRSNCAQISC